MTASYLTNPFGGMPRLIHRSLAIVLATLLVLWAYCIFNAADNLSRAEVASANGDLGREIELLRRAAQWNTPFNPYARDAVERLFELGQQYDSLESYRTLRYSVLVSRSLYTPHEDLLAQADAAIATLTAEHLQRNRDAIIESLQSTAKRAPEPALAFVIFLSLLGWLVGASGLLGRFAFPSTVKRQHVVAWLLLFATSMTVWIAGLVVA